MRLFSLTVFVSFLLGFHAQEVDQQLHANSKDQQRFYSQSNDGKYIVLANEQQMLVYDLGSKKVVNQLSLDRSKEIMTQDADTVFLQDDYYDFIIDKKVRDVLFYSDKEAVVVRIKWSNENFVWDFKTGERKKIEKEEYYLYKNSEAEFQKWQGSILSQHKRDAYYLEPYENHYRFTTHYSKKKYVYKKWVASEFRLNVSKEYFHLHRFDYATKHDYYVYEYKNDKGYYFQDLTGPLNSVVLGDAEWILGGNTNGEAILFNPITKGKYVFNCSIDTNSTFDYIEDMQILRVDESFWKVEGGVAKKLSLAYPKSKIRAYNPYIKKWITFTQDYKLYAYDPQTMTEELLHDFEWTPPADLVAQVLKKNQEDKANMLAKEEEQELAQQKEQEAKLAAQKVEQASKKAAQENTEVQKLKQQEAVAAVENKAYVDPTTIKNPVPFPLNHREHPLFKLAEQYSLAYKWKEAQAYWEEFTIRYADVADGYFYTSQALFYQQKYEEGITGFEQAHQMDPMSNGYMMDYLNCMASFQYNDRAAELGRKMASISDAGLVDPIRQELDQTIANNGTDSPYSLPVITAKNAFNAHYNSINANDNLYKVLSNSYNTVGADTWEGIWDNFTSLRDKLKKRGAEAAVYQFLLKDYYSFIDGEKGGDWIQSKIAEEYLNEYQKGEYSNLYHKVKVGSVMAVHYGGQADYEKAMALTDKLISELSQSGMFKHKLLELYQYKARLLFEMDRKTEFSNIAKQLEAFEGKYKNPYFDVQNKEMLALMYKDSDFAKAEKLALEALDIAEKNEIDKGQALKSLLSIIYFDNGYMEKGLKYTGIEGDISEMDEIQLFNAGTMLDEMGNTEKAEEFYLKSIAKFDEFIKDQPERVKLTERARINPVYVELARLYSKTRQPDKALEIVEKSKAQGLSSDLNAAPITTKQLQSILKVDEAFVSYKILDPSNFLIVIVTKDKVDCDVRSLRPMVNAVKNNFSEAMLALDTKVSQSIYQSPNYVIPKGKLDENVKLEFGDFELMIEFYRTFLTQEAGQYLPNIPEEGLNNIMKIMQEDLYSTLVSPYESVIEPKKKYYLSLDGVFNYIPFETFRNEEGYLAESAEYVNVTSAGILNLIKNRKYSPEKKSILAFGAAIYDLPETNVAKVKTLVDVNEWQLKSYDLAIEGKPLTDLFSSMGYGQMNYLAGTLAEVQEIGKIYDDATVVTGADMTEKKVKTMSANGDLKKYKVLHFATHGWVINSMPTISGLAMCIPKKSLDGEDGRLIACEIADLQLEADLVMLSACQTGLGKLYGGEGVLGLNQALLKAGSNATIVSLWPVNDYATSVLVSELYRIAKENGGDYGEALLIVKRNFIKGKYNTEMMDLTHPIYWAPFVYSGK